MAKTQREVEIEDDADLENQIDKNKIDLDDEEAARKSRDAVLGKDDEDLEDDGEDRREAYDEEEGDYRDERPSRRQRRNRARKEARRQDASIIAAQNERIQRLESAIASMSHGQLALHAGGIDQQMAETRGYLDQIDDAMAEAVAAADATKIKRAMRLRDEANAKLSNLAFERRRVEEAARVQQQQRQTAQPSQVEVDPDAERYSETFMDRHPWFDPTDLNDEDSQMVKAIDDTLVNSGYKPNTARYWKELERRVKARGLGEDREDDRGDYDDDDYGLERRSKSNNRRTGGLPGRSQRGGGGGSARRSDAFDERRLPALAKDTLDQLGLLDKAGLTDEQLKERQGLIDQWRKGLKAVNEAQRSR